MPLKRIVIKLGSNALTKQSGGLDQNKLTRVVSDCTKLWGTGIEVVLVSSGAVHTGREFLPPDLEKPIDLLQALSSIGQPKLMEAYSKLFNPIHCAQILLTHEDFKHRKRHLNVKNTLLRLLSNKVIPILNENDAVSFEEITVGDNDQLAAMIAEMIQADCLLMLSTPDGLFDQDPSSGDSKSIPVVKYSDNFQAIDLRLKTVAGRGGMRTKLEAVRKLTPLGIPVIVATYQHERPILRALEEDVGTFFEAKKLAQNKKKAWLNTIVKHDGSLVVDEGAYKALKKNSSLLPSGIIKVEGSFKRGDCISLVFKRNKFAVGISEYDGKDIKKILGKKSSEIEQVLGFIFSKVIVHRDNLMVREE